MKPFSSILSLTLFCLKLIRVPCRPPPRTDNDKGGKLLLPASLWCFIYFVLMLCAYVLFLHHSKRQQQKENVFVNVVLFVCFKDFLYRIFFLNFIKTRWKLFKVCFRFEFCLFRLKDVELNFRRNSWQTNPLSCLKCFLIRCSPGPLSVVIQLLSALSLNPIEHKNVNTEEEGR